jgi:hypothetical protein
VSALAEAESVPRLVDEHGEPTREAIRFFVASAIEAHLPSYKLSSDQYDTLTDALVRMRELRRELRETPRDPEHAERIAELRSALMTADEDFTYILGMSAAEFTERVQPGAGLSRFDPDEPIPPGEFLPDAAPANP